PFQLTRRKELPKGKPTRKLDNRDSRKYVGQSFQKRAWLRARRPALSKCDPVENLLPSPTLYKLGKTADKAHNECTPASIQPDLKRLTSPGGPSDSFQHPQFAPLQLNYKSARIQFPERVIFLLNSLHQTSVFRVVAPNIDRSFQC